MTSYICGMENSNLSIWDRVYLFWRYDLKYYPSKFVRGVKNLIEWFPIIWEDRDYDSQYLMDLMKFKIQKMSKLQGSTNSHVSTQRNVEIMNTVVRLIDKVVDETYRHEYYEYFDSKYKFVKVDRTDNDPKREDYYTMEEEITRDDTQDYINKYPRTYKQVTNQSWYKDDTDSKMIPIIMGDIRHEKAKHLLFSLMERNFDKWWE
jgi:hypothetical protein